MPNDPANPFGNHAEKVSSSPTLESGLAPSTSATAPQFVNAADFPLPESSPPTPRGFDDPSSPPSPLTPKPELATVPSALVPGALPVAGGAAAGAAAIAAATAAAASSKPQGSAPASPSPSGVVPAENVHRVQLDFKPSMGDELEIVAGQLVRVLHEYDDGWVSLEIT